jgi:alpha-N-acetylglucosaminidase
LTGAETVWKNVLTKLGYSKDEINDFVSGPGFTAW